MHLTIINYIRALAHQRLPGKGIGNRISSFMLRRKRQPRLILVVSRIKVVLPFDPIITFTPRYNQTDVPFQYSFTFWNEPIYTIPSLKKALPFH
jgi:hypothetical protein